MYGTQSVAHVKDPRSTFDTRRFNGQWHGQTYRLIAAGYLLLISVMIVGLPMEKKTKRQKILRCQEKLQYRDTGVTDINPRKKVYILAY